MKKIFSLFLVFGLIIGLSACGSSDEDTDIKDDGLEDVDNSEDKEEVDDTLTLTKDEEEKLTEIFNYLNDNLGELEIEYLSKSVKGYEDAKSDNYFIGVKVKNEEGLEEGFSVYLTKDYQYEQVMYRSGRDYDGNDVYRFAEISEFIFGIGQAEIFPELAIPVEDPTNVLIEKSIGNFDIKAISGYENCYYIIKDTNFE